MQDLEKIDWMITQIREKLKHEEINRAMELITQTIERSNRNVQSLYDKIDNNTQAKRDLLKELKDANKKIAMLEEVKKEVEQERKKQELHNKFVADRQEDKEKKREEIKYWITIITTVFGLIGAMWAFFNFLINSAT